MATVGTASAMPSSVSIVMVYVVMACVVMAYIYIVMTYIVMATFGTASAMPSSVSMDGFTSSPASSAAMSAICEPSRVNNRDLIIENTN